MDLARSHSTGLSTIPGNRARGPVHGEVYDAYERSSARWGISFLPPHADFCHLSFWKKIRHVSAVRIPCAADASHPRLLHHMDLSCFS